MLKQMAVKEEITKEEKEAVEKMLAEEQAANASRTAEAVKVGSDAAGAPVNAPVKASVSS